MRAMQDVPDESPVESARAARRGGRVAAFLFALVALFTGADLALDVSHGVEWQHALGEGLVLVLGCGGATWMLLRLRRLANETRRLGEEAGRLEARLEATREEAARWKAEAGDLVRGLGVAIDRQLERWGLTAAEQEVALLLLKGLSHREVAEVRGTGEATVRQQARAIYRKAGLAGRHDLAAFFLEDLLGPRGDEAHDETDPSRSVPL